MIKAGTDVNLAAQLLRDGKLVAFPTETVYGLGANGFDPVAVAKIFEAKQRPFFDPLILHIGSLNDLATIFHSPYPSLINQLAKKYWPGPLTIVAHRSSKVPDIVTAGLDTVGVRMPSHPVAQELINLAGIPLAAPSANLFGHLSPTEPKHVSPDLKGVDYLLEAGKTSIGIESTIVAVTKKGIEILRPGAITPGEIKSDFPGVEVLSSSTDSHIQAPGQLKSHYSPRKPLFLHDTVPGNLPPGSALLLFKPYQNLPAGARVFLLSENGDLLEGASNMFSKLHDLETDPAIKQIFAVKIKEEGIGIAIMDRLKKASYRYSALKETIERE